MVKVALVGFIEEGRLPDVADAVFAIYLECIVMGNLAPDTFGQSAAVIEGIGVRRFAGA